MISWNSSYNSADSYSSWGQGAGMTHSSSRRKEHNSTDSAFITTSLPRAGGKHRSLLHSQPATPFQVLPKGNLHTPALLTLTAS